MEKTKSPMKQISVLLDDTAIEEPRRESWYERVEGSSRDILEALDTNKMMDGMPFEVYEFEVEKDTENQSSVSESCDNESIASIVIPQRRLFNQKKQAQAFDDMLGSRFSLGRPFLVEDSSIEDAPKTLFNKGPRNRAGYPVALLNSTKKTINKTADLEPKRQARLNARGTIRKNIITYVISSDTEEDSEVQHKQCGSKNRNNKSWSLRTRNTRMPSLTQGKSSYKRAEGSSRDIVEALDTNKMTEDMLFQGHEFEAEKDTENQSSVSESCDNESIASIVIPQRRLFNQKKQAQAFDDMLGSRFSLGKTFVEDSSIEDAPKTLFNKGPRNCAGYPVALLNSTKKTINKTAELEPKRQARLNARGTRRKNIITYVVSSDTEEDSEVQHKQCGSKNKDNKSWSLRTRNTRMPSLTQGTTTIPAEIVTKLNQRMKWIAAVKRKRESSCKRVERSSRDIVEAVDTNKMTEDMLFQGHQFEVEKDTENQSSVSESCDNESIASIVIPERRLFNQKKQAQAFGDMLGSRFSLGKTFVEDSSIEDAPKIIFNKGPRNRPVYPVALLNSTNKTRNKTVEPEPNRQARLNIFRQAGTKGKNMFTNFVLSDSDEDSEVQHKEFGSQNRRMPSLTPSMTTEIDIDDWILLPSSTIIGAQKISSSMCSDNDKDMGLPDENHDDTIIDQNAFVNRDPNSRTHKKSAIKDDENDKMLINENINSVAESNPLDKEHQDEEMEEMVWNDNDNENPDETEIDAEAADATEENQKVKKTDVVTKHSVKISRNLTNKCHRIVEKPVHNDPMGDENEVLVETPNKSPHDPTDRNRKKELSVRKSPESLLQKTTKKIESDSEQEVRDQDIAYDCEQEIERESEQEVAGESDQEESRQEEPESEQEQSHEIESDPEPSQQEIEGSDNEDRNMSQGISQHKADQESDKENSREPDNESDQADNDDDFIPGINSQYKTFDSNRRGVSRIVFDTKMMSDDETDLEGVPRQTNDVLEDSRSHGVFEQSEREPAITRPSLPRGSNRVHDVSFGTKKEMFLMQLEKISQENQELRQKLREKLEKECRPRNFTYNDLNIMVTEETKYSVRQINQIEAKKPRAKPKRTGFPIEVLPKEFVEDLKYKPPKRFHPANAPWITKRLYKFLETKLEPKYDYYARKRAEKLVKYIYEFTKLVRRRKLAPQQAVDELKREMARLQVVKTHHDFYDFFHEFMPREIRIKVNPDLVNQIPMPFHVFSDILENARSSSE